MPIVDGKYSNPVWNNNAPPDIDAIELNAISGFLQTLGLSTFTLTVSLPTTGWSGAGPYTITVPATGVKPNPQPVLISPAPAYHKPYTEAGIRSIAQNTNTLTFEAEEVPTIALTVNVMVLFDLTQ